LSDLTRASLPAAPRANVKSGPGRPRRGSMTATAAPRKSHDTTQPPLPFDPPTDAPLVDVVEPIGASTRQRTGAPARRAPRRSGAV
jgi:hypothetical protein